MPSNLVVSSGWVDKSQCSDASCVSMQNIFLKISGKYFLSKLEQVSPSKDESLSTEPNRRNSLLAAMQELPPCLSARQCTSASCPCEDSA